MFFSLNTRNNSHWTIFQYHVYIITYIYSILIVDPFHRHPSVPRRNVTKRVVIQAYRVFCFCFVWCPCMAINIFVQYNDRSLPDNLLLTQALISVWFDGTIIVRFRYVWWLCMAINIKSVCSITAGFSPTLYCWPKVTTIWEPV